MKFVTRILVSALLTVAANAAHAGAGPLETVQQASDRMIAALKEERVTIKANRARLYTLVEEIVLPHFDFERMSILVLGKHWRTASDAQKAHFVQEFRALLVRTYATAMAEYRDQEIIYMPLKADPGADEVSVKSEIRVPGAPSIPVNYSLYLKNGKWKVYDVTIDGASLVANYRTSFSNEIKQGGLDALIDKLAARNQQSGKDSAATIKTNSAAATQ